MKFYKRKPDLVEAIQFDGKNIKDIAKFAKADSLSVLFKEDNYDCDFPSIFLEGIGANISVTKGHFVIKNINKEIETLSQDEFLRRYELSDMYKQII